ncbi:MAG: hydantoinase/oxoprolinase family protein [Candidatus Binatia bacterium]
MRRLSVDIGGTFTDCFLEWDGRHIEAKSLTTHHNLAVGFLEAVNRAAEEVGKPSTDVLASVDSVRYGTTLGTNALIERKGPRIGVLVTAGFESGLRLSRGRGYGEGLPRHLQVDLARATRPDPLVPNSLVVGIQERIDFLGEVIIPMKLEDVRMKIRRLVDNGAEAFVVSLVNSVVNASHEEKVEEIIRDEYPSSLFGSFPVILSHRISRRKSEYARTMAAVVCGFLHEHMFYSLGTLEDALRERGYTKPVLLIHNTGGMASLESTHALQTIHSGPVAGLAASQHLTREYDIPLIVATDMGGTSFDIGIIERDGTWIYDFHPVVDRWLVSTPMVYLRTLGAGGGSIARYDRLWRTVEVGPDSAGSDPGPACYGRGGSQPTVSDADLVLGYLDPEYYAGGTLSLDPALAELAIEEHVAEALGISVLEAAKLIKRKVDANMADAIFKEVGTRGFDVKNLKLLSYGGGGPVHCCGFARALEAKSVLIPPFASVFSAFGAGNLGQLHIHERSAYLVVYNPLTREVTLDLDRVNAMIEECETLGRDDLARQGFQAKEVAHQVEFDMRYGNQLVQLSVLSPVTRLRSVDDTLAMIEVFSKTYASRFGVGASAPEAGIKIIAVRVLSWVPAEKIPLAGHDGAKEYRPTSTKTRTCHFWTEEQPVETLVHRWTDLKAGAVITGPAIVESPHTTFVVEPGWDLRLGSAGEVWMNDIAAPKNR